MCPLSALYNMAAFDLRNEHTEDSAAVQLYNEGTVPKVLHKMPGIRANKGHAAMMGTDLRKYRGPPRQELSSTTMAKRLAFANANMRKKTEPGAVH